MKARRIATVVSLVMIAVVLTNSERYVSIRGIGALIGQAWALHDP